MKKSFNHSKGFTLIELMIVGVISLFIIATVYYAYKLSERDVKVRETTAMVSTLLEEAQVSTAMSSSFSVKNASGVEKVITMPVLLANSNEKNYPVGITISNNKVYSPYGEMTITVDSSVSNAHDLFKVNVLHVPKNSCVAVLSRLSTKTYDMYVNNKLVALTPPKTPLANGRNSVRVDQASKLCNNEYNNLSFRELKKINFYELRRKSLGNKLSDEEKAIILPLYNRNQNALIAKENAQKALD